MADSKAKRKAKKKTKSRGSRKLGKASRNWARINQQWLESDETLDGFIRLKKLPRSTARQKLDTVKVKNSKIKQATGAAEKFRYQLAKRMAKDESRIYVGSLKHVAFAAQEILLDSAEAFKASAFDMSKEKAGRMAMAAGDQLISVTQLLQGIPDEDEIDGWPLSRLFHPFKYQRDFVHDTPKSIRQEEGLPSDGSRDPFVLALIGGRGAGKTYIGAQKSGQLAWLNRGKNGCVLAPTYPKLRDAAKAAFLKACTDKGLSFTHLKTENAIILFGDTKIYFRSMDDPDSVRGLNLAWAWPDELGQLQTREAFDVLNGCIRGDDIPEPAILITTTPSGLNWLYDILITNADENKARLYRVRTVDNPVLGDFEQRLRASYDPKFAAQELDAEFLDIFAGKAYWNWSPIENVFAPAAMKLHEAFPIDLCCDFNVSPMCWNVSQDIPQNGDIFTYVHDEIHLDTAGTDITIKEFIERYGLHKAALAAGVRVWGDATGQHKGTSATRSDYQIIEDALKAADIPVEIHIGRGNPRQRDRVLAVNARLLNAKGSRRFFVSSKCKYTKIDFERTSFIPGTQQLDKAATIGSQSIAKNRKKATLTHHTDAVGYKIFRQWPVRQPVVTQGRA